MLGGRKIDLGSESRSGPGNRTVGTDSVDLIDVSFIQGISIGYKPEFGCQDFVFSTKHFVLCSLTMPQSYITIAAQRFGLR